MENKQVNMQIEHCRHELSGWTRTLSYLQQENVYLKNYLIKIIKNASDQLLDKIEYYHNLLINKDTHISLLRQDIAEQHKILESSGGNIPVDFSTTQKKLGSDMQKMENELVNQKYDFNSYFAGLLL